MLSIRNSGAKESELRSKSSVMLVTSSASAVPGRRSRMAHNVAEREGFKPNCLATWVIDGKASVSWLEVPLVASTPYIPVQKGAAGMFLLWTLVETRTGVCLYAYTYFPLYLAYRGFHRRQGVHQQPTPTSRCIFGAIEVRVSS